jgi:hypothetical protein
MARSISCKWLCVSLLVSGIAATGGAQEPGEVEGVRAKKFTLQPAQLEYYLIAAEGKLETPEHGYKMLVVMPGGDGSADFQPFIKNIYMHALDENWLLVQLVAPKWDQDQGIVWPTARSKVRGQKASVEEFVKLAVEDVAKRSRVDKRHVYTLSMVVGWASRIRRVAGQGHAGQWQLCGDECVPSQRVARVKAAGEGPALLHPSLTARPGVPLSNGRNGPRHTARGRSQSGVRRIRGRARLARRRVWEFAQGHRLAGSASGGIIFLDHRRS